MHWRVTQPELDGLAARLRAPARGAWGRSGTGMGLLIALLEEQLLTFAGRRGDVVADDRGIRIQPR